MKSKIIKERINSFINELKNGNIDLYNEFGIQFELAL